MPLSLREEGLRSSAARTTPRAAAVPTTRPPPDRSQEPCWRMAAGLYLGVCMHCWTEEQAVPLLVLTSPCTQR